MGGRYVEIIVPLAVSGTYTYAVPDSLSDIVTTGSLVTVPFGQQNECAGLVTGMTNEVADDIVPRMVTGVISGSPVINSKLVEFIMWVSDYYLALPGEVMKAAIPSSEDFAYASAGKKKKESVKEESHVETELAVLSRVQEETLEHIRSSFSDDRVVLLHGVTSSGKTEIYIHLIQEQISRGFQVVYLLPEISLTTQITERLKRYFGDRMGVFHSRMSKKKRMEVWRNAADGSLSLILGVRSSLFLPYVRLGLVIVDEEHDTSYKQNDPAPRYHARDAAIMLSKIHRADTLLGSATPSVESYHNAITGRYALSELNVRYGEVMMPEMVVADLRSARKKGMTYFTPSLLKAITEAVSKNEQVILFQNRRGFSPYLMCSDCGWVHRCSNCSVSYTWHKGRGRMECHHCGRSEAVPVQCPQCGSATLRAMGLGTEKVEEEIKLLFPGIRVARMDHDTTRRERAASEILSAFASGETDILIGTQMISKGLDFEKLTVVGILDADSMLWFPDFRAFERSFQLIEQVSGRAGRRNSRGKVIIQTADPSHIIIRQAVRHDYKGMCSQQIEERELFGYPPFTKIIKIVIRHRDLREVNESAERLASGLRTHLGGYLMGPEFPVLMQVQRWYIKNIIIKIGKELSVTRVKDLIRKAIDGEIRRPRQGQLRIHADVDPL